MDLLNAINIFVFCLSLFGILLVVLFYPLAVSIFSGSRSLERDEQTTTETPTSVSMVVAVRNGESCVGEKIRNSLNLDYPSDRFDIVLFSDGSTDNTERVIKSYRSPQVKLYSSSAHQGKAHALNQGILKCQGDIVVFSDADALLSKDALKKLVRHYRDPTVGGVCGQRVILEDGAELKKAQGDYIKFDSAIKSIESRGGSITSNDGKLYSIRRELFQPIETAVTDDLYVSLTVIKKGYRFLFDPEAYAYVRLPSRNPSHEVERRRRIVSRSLRGIYLMKGLLNPFRHGVFALGLLINKVLRRLIPLCLILLFTSTLFLSFFFPLMRALLIIQGVFYFSAFTYPVLCKITQSERFRHAASVPFYFCIGNYGTLLGLADFVLGRRISKWEPRKTD